MQDWSRFAVVDETFSSYVQHGQASLAAGDEDAADVAFESAIEMLAHGYKDVIYGYCTNKLGRWVTDRDGINDVAQNTFLGAFQSVKRFDPTLPVRPWLFRIAHNKCVDEIQRIMRAAVTPLTDRVAQPHTPAPAASREEDDCLRAARTRLKEEDRDILDLKYMQDLPTFEIADFFQITEGAVRVRLKRARDRLKKQLERTRGTQT